MAKTKRLQGVAFHARKHALKAIAYSVTKNGNIAVYYKGNYKHYLNEEEKKAFNPEGLEEWYKQ